MKSRCLSEMKSRCLSVLLLLAASYSAMIPTDHHILIVIDAGSSGSRLQLYHWKAGDSTPEYGQWDAGNDQFKTEPGISSLTPDKAAESIQGLLDVAAKQIDEGSRKAARVYLGATAGMRLLTDADRSLAPLSLHYPSSCSPLCARACTRCVHDRKPRFDAIRTTIAASPFTLGAATTLSGEEEATFGWMAVNW